MKRKKLIPILLAIVLLIGLLPMTALAASTPKLVMRYINEDGSPSEEYTNGWFPVFCHYVTYYPALLFNDTLLPIDPALLHPADPSALSVVPSTEYAGAVYMESLALGPTELLYTHSDGRTYRFDVHADIPSVGFFSKPDGAGLNYLQSFTAREGNDTIYLVVQNGRTIEGLSLEHFANDCTYTISPDKSMATITIGPNAEPPAYPYAVAAILDEWGQLKNWTVRLDLTTEFPNIYYRPADWSTGFPTENPGFSPFRTLEAIKGGGETCYFYFFDGTEETLLSPKQLSSNNEDIVTVSPDELDPKAVRMDITGFGSTEIAYDHNGRTYSLPIRSELPDYGLFTAPVFTEAAYIDSAIGIPLAEGDTVYFILGDRLTDCTIAGVHLFEDDGDPFPEGTACTIAADGRSAAITMGKVPAGKVWCKLWFDLHFPESGASDRLCDTLLVNDAAPAPTPVPIPPKNPFTDVSENNWFYAPIMWAVENGITGGLTPNSFGPNNTCTRAQVVTFLYAAAGKPEVSPTANPFTDVSENDWFYAPIMWAVENGITGGLTPNSFGPNETCTRAQVVTFLYAAAGKPEMTISVNPFTDVAGSDWFYAPIMWAVENGITGGLTPNTFGPNNTCTRAQVVTFLFANETK